MKRKFSLKKTINTLILFICIIIFLISLVHIINYINSSNKTKKEIKKITEDITTTDVNDNVEIIESNDDKKNPYWDFIELNMKDIDISKLKEQNKDTIGWIEVKGTNVNYPFVQTSNNDYYLTHSFNKSYNSAGWVFLDYRNNIKNLDKNTIIYAHGRYDKTMFGTLKNVFNNTWLNNKNNYLINISTDSSDTMWQIFSIYKIKTTTDYLKINFDTSEFNEFIKLIKDRSQYNFDTSVSENDKILTLSTCYNNEIKIVIHAKLIKIREKDVN